MVGWPGNALGLMTLLASRPAEADVEAAEPTTVAVVQRSALDKLLASEPRVALSVLSECTRQLFDVMGVVKQLSIDVVGRVATYILVRIPADTLRSQSRIKVDLGVSRIELAAELGTVPETLSRAFSTLQDAEIIATHGRSVHVLDVKGLELRAAGDTPQRA
jgi:CRP/FNR family transcriptional regulator